VGVGEGKADKQLVEGTYKGWLVMASNFLRCCGGEQNPPDWQEILTHFRGSELQNYFMRILEDDLHAIIKPQYVDHIPKAVR
jgi:ATP-binding cassette, sub-family E, member 1